MGENDNDNDDDDSYVAGAVWFVPSETQATFTEQNSEAVAF